MEHKIDISLPAGSASARPKTSVETSSANYLDPASPVGLAEMAAPGQQLIKDGELQVMRSILPGGVRLITQSVPASRSTSLGFWVEAGSRDERRGEGGASHFLEHLLFKGTNTRSAFEIAESFDAVGADSNAATTKEFTYYWSHMVSEDLPELLPVLSDMVTDSLLRSEDIEVERGVILDELSMSEDTPTDVVAEAFARAIYGNARLGRPIGGTSESVAALPAETIRDLYQKRYSAPQLVVSAAGDLEHNQVTNHLMDALEASPWAEQLVDDVTPNRRNGRSGLDLLGFDGLDPAQAHSHGSIVEGDFERDVLLRREIEQAHIATGGMWLSLLDPIAPVSAVTMSILGGGMSSRLFQEIREKRGLAYSTYAFASAYSDSGHFGLYAGCAPNKLKEVEKVLWGEVEKLAESGPSPKELARIKGQMRGTMTLGLEDNGSRMSRLARAEMIGRFLPVDDVLARIGAVQAEDVRALAERMLKTPRATAVVTSNE